MKKRKIAVIAGIIFVILCALLYILIYTIPEITGALKQTCIVEYGQMRVSEKLPAVVVRQETVYTAEYSGNLVYYIDNNTKTRAYSKIYDLYGTENKSFYSPFTGIVSYFCDGYETVFTKDNLTDVFDIISDKEISKIDVKDVRKDHASKDDPTYKLITKDTWYTVVQVPLTSVDKYTTGASITLGFDVGSVKAKIDSVLEKEGYALAIASTSKYCPDFDKLRLCEVEVILQDDKGLIVPNTAIAMEDGNPGVYVKKIDGEYKFTRIKVISSDGTNSVVYADTFNETNEQGKIDTFATISIYDEILKDASDTN